MSESETREIATKTDSTQLNRFSCANLIPIVPSVQNDLIFSRRLTAQSLANDDLPSALAFTSATAKLLPVVAKAGLHDHTLLRRPAVYRLAGEIMGVVSAHLQEQLPDTFHDVVDSVCATIATELEGTP